MKIGIDISRTVNEATGVGYYAKNLVRALADIDSANEYLLYGIFYDCFPPAWKEAAVPQKTNFRLHQKGYPSWYVMRGWRNARAHRERLLGGVDIVHSTAYTMPLVGKSGVAVTIHDLSVFVHPEYHTAANYAFVANNVLLAARQADVIIADSEHTMREIRRFLHVPEERIAVVHLAAAEDFYRSLAHEEVSRLKEKYRIRAPYFLAVGSIEPRKNLARALVAFKALVEIANVDHQFVIVGGGGWKNETFYRLIGQLGIDDRLLLTGYVPEEDLPGLYQGADAFVYPSIYEGFGLPVLEAMASGVPVITSSTTSLPEVAGNAALFVEPTDVNEIFEAMEALATKPGLRDELRQRGLKQSRRFSWERTARQTLDVYCRVFQRRSFYGTSRR